MYAMKTTDITVLEEKKTITLCEFRNFEKVIKYSFSEYSHSCLDEKKIRFKLCI